MDAGCDNIIKVDKLNRCVTVIKPNATVGEPPKMYYFDNVFAEDSTQVCTINFFFFFIFLLHLLPMATNTCNTNK